MSDDPFVTNRSLLFTVAYEMLGSAADAEDVVQETWLRWAGVDQAEVRDPRAYLVRIVTRQSLNRLRALSRQREQYIGEWLPEPLLTSPDVAEDVEFAENVSIAMLTVLETLGPTERAVFVLHEVFETPYGEIAEAVGKTQAAVRQIARRARDHVAARRPRMQVDRAQQRAAVEKFMAAIATGDLQVIAILAIPVLSMRSGLDDASTDPPSSTTYQAYQLLAKGFGPGFNGPLVLVGQVNSPADRARFARLAEPAPATPPRGSRRAGVERAAPRADRCRAASRAVSTRLGLAGRQVGQRPTPGVVRGGDDALCLADITKLASARPSSSSRTAIRPGSSRDPGGVDPQCPDHDEEGPGSQGSGQELGGRPPGIFLVPSATIR